METVKDFSETSINPNPTVQNDAESIVRQEIEALEKEIGLSVETPNLEFEAGPDGFIRIPLDLTYIDGSIFPRAALDRETIENYTAALIRLEKLPPITVEDMKNGEFRVLMGVHRFEAYCLRRDIYNGKFTGDFYDEPLFPLSDIELNTIPCFIGVIPPDIHPMVFLAQDNLKHGKPLTSEDYEMIARQVYKDNVGASITGLAKSLKISRKVFKKYVCDLVEDFEKEKQVFVVELASHGVSQTEIAKELKEKFPYATGVSQSQVSEILKKKDTATEASTGEDPVNDGDEELSEDSDLEDDRVDGETEHEPAIEPPQAPSKPVELQIINGNESDSIMIIGLGSLTPGLQEKMKKEVEKLVNQVRDENRAAQVPHDPDQGDKAPCKP